MTIRGETSNVALYTFVLSPDTSFRLFNINEGSTTLANFSVTGWTNIGDGFIIRASTGPIALNNIRIFDIATGGRANRPVHFDSNNDMITLSEVVFQNLTLPSNSASAFRLNNGNAMLTDCQFLSVRAGLGPISSRGVSLTIQNSVFADCLGDSAGAILAQGNNGIVTVQDSMFLRNAGSQSSGIRATPDTPSLTIVNSTFLDNVGFGDSGVIQNSASSFSVSDSLFQGNRMLSRKNFRLFQLSANSFTWKISQRWSCN